MSADDQREQRYRRPRRQAPRGTPVPERFWIRVVKGSTDDCWTWTGGTRSTGYGSFHDGRRIVSAHRYAYELLVGAIPPGLVLDHLCKMRLCVNPAHLEPVTNRENVLRGEGITARNATKTHCINGHEFTPENTYIQPSEGRRTCKTCRRATDRRRRAA